MRAVPFFSSRSAALVFRISRLYHLLLVHSPDSLNLKKKKDCLQSNLSGVQVQNKIQCTFHPWSYCQVSPLKVPDIPVGSSMGIPTKLSLLIVIFYNFAKKVGVGQGHFLPPPFMVMHPILFLTSTFTTSSSTTYFTVVGLIWVQSWAFVSW